MITRAILAIVLMLAVGVAVVGCASYGDTPAPYGTSGGHGGSHGGGHQH